ncbi:MAG: tyrosine-type recombinase/integrase [Candidatus Omnitrophica bacterium]|nr:tyrosine-type recombinase/integrase [Candidatus Omnitrophota bacterium]
MKTNKTISLNLPWNKLIEEFLAKISTKKTTIETYQYALNSWVAFLEREEKPIDSLRVMAYQKDMLERDLSAYTIGVYLSALKKFFDYLIEKKQMTINLVETVVRPEKPEARKECLAHDEFLKAVKLLDEWSNNTANGLRDRTIIAFKLFTGLRDISLVTANIKDFQIKDGIPTLHYQAKGKNSKDKMVILTRRPYRILTDYLNKRPSAKIKDPLLVSHSRRNPNQRLTRKTFYRVGQNFLKSLGIQRPTVTPHSLRHTAITFAIIGGADITQAKDMAGHKHIETTEGYRHKLTRLTDPAEEYIEKYVNKQMSLKKG